MNLDYAIDDNKRNRRQILYPITLYFCSVYLQENREGLELLKEAIAKAGYTDKIKIGMDTAASEFYKEGGKYDLDFKNPASDPSKWLTGWWI